MDGGHHQLVFMSRSENWTTSSLQTRRKKRDGRLYDGSVDPTLGQLHQPHRGGPAQQFYLHVCQLLLTEKNLRPYSIAIVKEDLCLTHISSSAPYFYSIAQE